jgi:hypothetical protein
MYKWKANIKTDLKKRVEKCDLDIFGNELSGSITGGEFNDYWTTTNFLSRIQLHAVRLASIKKLNSSWHVPEIMHQKNGNSHVLQF